MWCVRILSAALLAATALACVAAALNDTLPLAINCPAEANRSFVRPSGFFTANITSNQYEGQESVFKVSPAASTTLLTWPLNPFLLQARPAGSAEWKDAYTVRRGDQLVELRFKDSAQAAEGTYALRIFIYGAEAASSANAVAVDSTAPTVSFAKASEKTPSVRAAFFAWKVGNEHPGPLSYAHSLDGLTQAAWGADPNATLAELQDGFHNFTAMAKDAAGNVGSSTPYTWLVDTQPPQCEILSPADGYTVPARADAEVRYNDTYLNLSSIGQPVAICMDNNCTNATGSGSSWRASFDTTDLDEGPHTIKAMCSDNSGNRADDAVTVNVYRGGSTGPVVFQINGGAKYTNGWTLNITVTSVPEYAPDRIRLSCSTNFPPAWRPYPPTEPYAFDLSANDQYGCDHMHDGIKNVWLQPGHGETPWIALSSAAIILDRTPPEAKASPLPGETVRTDAAITVTLKDLGPDPSGVDAATLYYEEPGGVLKRFQSGVPFVPGWTEGRHGLYVKFADMAGNKGSQTFDYRVDNQMTYAFSIIPANASVAGPGSMVTVNVTTYGAALEWARCDNGSGPVAFQSGVPFALGRSGNQTLRVCAKASGKAEECRAYAFYVDADAPSISLWPVPGTEIGQNWTLAATINDASAVDAAWFDNGNGTRMPLKGGTAFSPGWDTPGAKMLTAWANDTFGNSNMTAFNYTVKEGQVQQPPWQRPECVPTEQTEQSCSDGKDNDCDGLVDNKDPDCKADAPAYELASDASAYMEIEQGATATLRQTVSNTGRVPLDLDAEAVSPEQIQMTPSRRSLHLSVGEGGAAEFTVHVPLKAAPGDYKATLKYSGPPVDGMGVPPKSSSLVVAVREAKINGATLSSLMSRVESDLHGYEQRLTALETQGIDTSETRSKADEARQELAVARKAVDDDDAAALKSHMERAMAIEDTMPTSLSLLEFVASFLASAPYIIGATLLFLFAAYFASRFIMPFMDLRKRLAELQKQESLMMQARRNAEIQYFRRQLDEKTFRSIMVQEQTKLLNIRTQIGDISKKTHGLFGAMLSPSEFRRFYASAIRNRSLRAAGHERVHVSALRQRWLQAKPTAAGPMPRQERPETHSHAMHARAKKAELSGLEKRLHSLRGAERKEAEAMLHMAHDYADRGMNSMTDYYVQKVKRLLRE